MAYLIASATVTRFSSTFATVYGSSEFKSYINGNDSQGLTAGATGTAATLSMSINSWGSATNIKVALYDEDALVETLIISSSEGTGVIDVALAGTTTITSGNLYRLAIYSESGVNITLDTDTSGLTLRDEQSGSGSYTSPIDPYPAGGFDSNNEFYFAIQDTPAAGPVITDVNTTDSVQVGDTPNVNGTLFLATAGSQTFDGETVGVDTWSDTQIVCTAIIRDDKSYGAHDWVVTDNLAVDSSPLSVTLAIDTGFQFVNLVDPIIALVGGEITSLCYNTSPACVTGDQLKVPTLTDQGKVIDISAADGTFVITDAGNTEQTFSFEIWDATGPTNEKWSLSTAAVINGVIQTGGIMRNVLRSPLSNVLSDVIN